MICSPVAKIWEFSIIDQPIWVILLKPGHYCDIEVENLKFDMFYFLYCR